MNFNMYFNMNFDMYFIMNYKMNYDTALYINFNNGGTAMNIILIGMSGAGKSTLGVLLAKALGMGYVDTDIIIQQHQGKLLQEIIDNEGIDRFLQIEEEIVSALDLQDCVIATGGSVVYSEEAMNALRQMGPVFYLHVPYEEIERRLTNITTRGIVIKKGKSLRDVYEERVPLYIKYCDKVIDCSAMDIEACVDEIVQVAASYRQ